MVDFDPEQLKAAENLRVGNILVGGVGSGKSRTSLLWWFHYICGGVVPINESKVYKPITRPVDLYVITTAYKRDTLDWEQEILPFVFDRRKIRFKVDSWNNIAKYEDISNACFIFDEQHVVGYGKWSKTFIKIAHNHNYWILLSATPGDTYSDYMPVFIANRFYKNKNDFEWKHVVYKRFSKFPQIERYINTDILENHIQNIVITMDVKRSTVRHFHTVEVKYDKKLYNIIRKDRFDIWKNRPFKNISGLCAGLRKVVDSDDSRMIAIKHIMQDHPRVIIFYNYTFELNALRLLMKKMDYSYAEWNGELHQPIPKGKQWAYLVQYTAGAEGWNCIDTDTIIFYSLNYSYKIMEQSCGRIDRMNTKFVDLHYYRLVSKAPMDQAILRSVQDKKKFNERTWMHEQGIVIKEKGKTK